MDKTLMSDKFTRPIGEVDLHTRIYRQCKAMVAVLCGRGGVVPPRVLELIPIMDVGIEDSDKIPIRDLMALHTALAEAIRPELPQAAELLQWEVVRPKRLFWDMFNFLAPVAAIRKVLVFTILCFAAFFTTLIFGPLTPDDVANGIPLFNMSANVPPTVADGGFWLRYGLLICLTVFFTSLSAIGACFATLYDANRYLTNGTYDPRHGSSYAIRIGLGMMSGFLLSQVLTTQSDDLAVFGRTVLALLGGFAGQLVYDILNKLVRTVESIFEEDPREMRVRMTAEAETREKVVTVQQKAVQAAEASAFASRMEATSDPSLRAELTREFVAQATGTAIAPSFVAASGDPASTALEKAAATAALLQRVLAILPTDQGAPVRKELDRLEKAIARIRSLTVRGDVLAETAKLGAVALADGPLKDVLAKSLGKLAAPLASLGITPAGLALTVVTLAGQLGTASYRRWKARVLDAPYLPDLLPVDPIDAASVKTALDGLGDAAAALAIAPGDMGALNAVGLAAADLDPDAFYERFGRGVFGGARDAFDKAVAPFRDRMRSLRKAELDRQVLLEMPDDVLALSGAKDRGILLAAFDRLQASSDTLAELEKLFLLAAATRDRPGGAAELQALGAVLTSLMPKGADK